MSKAERPEDIDFQESLAEEPPAPPFRELMAKDPSLCKAARLYWVTHTKDGVLNTLTHSFLQHCPSGFVSDFGNMLVPLARWSYRSKIFPKRISRNFSALTPGRWTTEDAERSGLDRWWSNIGRTISEFSIVNKLWKNSHISVEGFENLELAKSTRSPLIFTSVHTGTWEALFVAIHEGLAGPSIGPFQPEPNRFKNRIVHTIRKKRNQLLFPPGQRSAFYLHRLMNAGNCSMTIFIDEVRDNQVHLPLFGREPPSKGNAVVAIKIANACGGTLVPTYLTRTGPARFKMVILPPLARQMGEKTYGIPETVQDLNAIFEPIVLEHIEEWYMLGELRLPKAFEQGEYSKQLARKNSEIRPVSP